MRVDGNYKGRARKVMTKYQKPNWETYSDSKYYPRPPTLCRHMPITEIDIGLQYVYIDTAA